ncbi:MAG: aspartate racemase [Saprospiraceae bacterium]|jgi:aspartate racemase
MKLIGLIGGITWQSTIMYYVVLNQLAAQDKGLSHSARCLIHSVEFSEISRLQKEDRWDLLDEIMMDAAQSLERGGASQIIICANTMHLSIIAIRSAVSIPVVHIAEATADQIITKGISTVALLGTKYTMEKNFYKKVLSDRGIDTIIPDEQDRDEIHRIIYDELSQGILSPESKAIYIKAINKLIAQGAEGIILGCTEIPLLIKDEDVSVPTFDTTTIHATAAYEQA